MNTFIQIGAITSWWHTGYFFSESAILTFSYSRQQNLGYTVKKLKHYRIEKPLPVSVALYTSIFVDSAISELVLMASSTWLGRSVLLLSTYWWRSSSSFSVISQSAKNSSTFCECEKIFYNNKKAIEWGWLRLIYGWEFI